jgi:hypothetical protein
MRDPEIDDILKRAAQSHADPDAALLAKIAGSIQPTLRPVRPLPPTWVLAGALGLVGMALALAIAAILGLHGVEAMSGPQILVLAALPILIGRATVVWTAEMIPGSRRHESPAIFFAICCMLLLALFAILFRDDTTGNFVSQGVPCLRAGLLAAVPVALAGWWLLRRGFAVNPTGAGLAAGTLAGLAGVSMLELHCQNFQTWHVLVWHIAVIPVSAAAGALAARLANRRITARG